VTFEPREKDDGCSLGRGANFGGSATWLGALAYLIALTRRRRSHAGVNAALLALSGSGCEDELAPTRFDGGQLDASQQVVTDAAQVDAQEPPASSGCIGDELTFPLGVAIAPRAPFDLLATANRADLVYLTEGCGSTARIAQSSALRHVSFMTTGDAGLDMVLGADDCLELREPTLVAHSQMRAALFVAAGEISDVHYAPLDGATKLMPQTHTSELREVALAAALLAGGSAPTLAYVPERSRINIVEPASIHTVQPGKISEELLPLTAQQHATKLAISALAARTANASGVVAWVNNLAPQQGVYARLVNELGQGVGELATLTRAVGAQTGVALAVRDDGAAVAYTESLDNAVHELRFRAISTAGELGSAVKLTAASQDVVHLAMAPYRNGFAVAYRSRATSSNPATSIKLLFVDQRGELGGQRYVAATTATGTKVALVVGNDGRLIVAWDEETLSFSDGGVQKLQLRVMRLICS
jgi:hypothetical protein